MCALNESILIPLNLLPIYVNDFSLTLHNPTSKSWFSSKAN